MKNLMRFLLILLLFSFSEIQAQQSDTLQLMKRKSKQFIATIETNEGLKKGILYDADSSKIMILDSLYHIIEVPISSIQSLIIRRSNNIWYGGKVGFLMAEIPALIISTVLLVAGIGSGEVGYILPYMAAILIYAIPFALVSGGIIAIFSGLVPTVSIDAFENEQYFKKLRVINLKTQKNLLKKFPKSPRVYLASQ